MKNLLHHVVPTGTLLVKRLMLLCSFILMYSGSYAQYTQAWQITPDSLSAAASVFTDSKQNVVVTLRSGQVSKFDQNGQLLWQTDVAERIFRNFVDKNDNIYIQSQTSLTKLNSKGTLVWEYPHNGHANESMAVSDQGDIFWIASSSIVDDPAGSVYIVKINASGTEGWQKKSDKFSGYSAAITSITTDKDGNVLVVGSEEMPGKGQKVVLSKYQGATGDLLWEKTYADLGDLMPHDYFPHQILTDSSGMIYIVGEKSVTVFSAYELLVMQMNPDGELMWMKEVIGSQGKVYFADAVLDSEDNLVLMGSMQDQSNGFFNNLIVKLNSAGEELWTDETLEKGPKSETSGRLYVLNNGRVGLVSTFQNIMEGGTMAIVYTKEGDRYWEERYPEASKVRVTSMASDDIGNLYIAGNIVKQEGEPTTLLLQRYVDASAACPGAVAVRLWLPPYAMKVGEQVRTTAELGNLNLSKDTGVRWAWGDDSTSISYTAFGSPNITGEHRYQSAGIYSIGLDFSQSCLTAVAENYRQWMVIFDPEAGSVKGAGVMQSPQAALPMMQEQGAAAFSFALEYKQKAYNARPAGFTVMALQNRTIFSSNSLHWLVIRGDQAVWRGTGKVNGKGHYGFIAAAADGKGQGINDPGDKLRIRIWNMDAGDALVYDNFGQDIDIMDMSQNMPAIRYGQILINGSIADALAPLAAAVVQEMEASVYPTRFSDKATLRFTLVNGGAYNVSVFDLHGTLVKEVKQGEAFPQEPNEIQLDGSALPGGMYIARVVSDEGVKSIKIILEK